MVLTSNQYNYFSDISYLNNVNDYYSDLSLSYDLSNQYLYDSLNNANITNVEYLMQQTPAALYSESSSNDIQFVNLNKAIVDSMKDNNNMIVQQSNNESQYLKSISNRLKNLENNKYNNQLINDIFNGRTDTASTININNQGELEIVNDQINVLTNKNIIKKKQVKIAEYYNKKRQHQIKVFKTACIILFIMFVIGILFKMGIIPDNLFAGFMGLGFAILVIYFGYVSIDMLFRDNENYDEYKFINSNYYLNKNSDGAYDDIPSYLQKDLVSSQCLDSSLNNTSSS
jgi:hypothetical protein